MKTSIQVLKPYFRVEETLYQIRECLERGWSGMGYKTEEFESEWKRYSGFVNAHFLNSATSGLHLAVNIFKSRLGWQDGDEIISTPLTFVSTNHAIMYERMNPVFADVDEKTLCLDPESVKRSITKKTRAVIYVGIGGNAAGYKEIKDICRKNGLVLILDAAHMAGTKWKDDGCQVGHDSDCAVFSFQAVKNCPSGDAGIICFKEKEFDTAARKLAWLGIDKNTYARYSESSYKWRYDVDEIGFKYHGNSIMASLCLVSLKYLDEDNAYRRKLANIYLEELSRVDWIELINHSDDILSSRHTLQILVEERDDFIDRISEFGVYCGVHYVDNRQYRPYQFSEIKPDSAAKVSERLVSLPLHLNLTEEDVRYICERILKIF